ncbi:MAG: helix-turn-helix transcriptional regulator [Planctomycetota bacterium]
MSPFDPERDAGHKYPAVEYARASLARNIIRSRVQPRLTQLELAKLAGIRNETLRRLERGQHAPSVATIARIEKALKQVSPRKRNGRQTQ